MKNIILVCPNCENELEAEKDIFGTQVKCPVCNECFWAKKSLVAKRRSVVGTVFKWLFYALLGAVVFLFAFGKMAKSSRPNRPASVNVYMSR